MHSIRAIGLALFGSALFAAPAAGQAASAAGGKTPATPGLRTPGPFFSDDFEGDTSGWVYGGCTGDCSVDWYFSSDGECGSIGKMLVFNNPDFLCLYGWVDDVLTGSIVSPAFRLDGAGPFSLSLDAIVDNDITEDGASIVIQDHPFSPTQSDLVTVLSEYAPSLNSYTFDIPNSESWAGKVAYLRLTGSSDNLDGHESARGWFLDNLVVHSTGAAPSTACLPALQVEGRLAVGGSARVRLPLAAPPATGARLIVGLGFGQALGDCTPFAGFTPGTAFAVGRRSVGVVSAGAEWALRLPASRSLTGLELQLQAVAIVDGSYRATPVLSVGIDPPR